MSRKIQTPRIYSRNAAQFLATVKSSAPNADRSPDYRLDNGEFKVEVAHEKQVYREDMPVL